MVAATLAATPAAASETPLGAYARGRAADADGRVVVAADNYAVALAAQPDDPVIAVRALRQALASGDLALARRAGAVLEAADIAPPDIAVLRFADALVANDVAGQRAAITGLADGPLAFLTPILLEWDWVASSSTASNSFSVANREGEGAVTRRYVLENRALLLIASGHAPEGLNAVRALLTATRPTLDLRLNAAKLLSAAGRKQEALSLLNGQADLNAAALLRTRTQLSPKRFGASRLFVRVAADLIADGTEPLAVMLTRAALSIDPGYQRARLVLADAIARDGSLDQAELVLSEIPADDAFAKPAAEMRVALFARAGEQARAMQAARQLAEAPGADPTALRTYGDLLFEAGRNADAARLYAAAMAGDGAQADWTLYLQRGGALEQAGEWDAALPLLREAARLAPDQPEALNYLGYAQVERGQNIDVATRLIERAHALAPDDAAIMDSLGWARYQRGDLARALPLLERAAKDEPADVTINEHLGDAYWKLGRRYEARYAWSAAALVAEEAAAIRLQRKLAAGLTSPHR